MQWQFMLLSRVKQNSLRLDKPLVKNSIEIQKKRCLNK
jgi:hypothetical protein